MRCPGCEGTGCSECKETGKIHITECPLRIVTSDIWQVIQLAELFEKGLPPVSGGTLEQAKNFIDVASFIIAEKAYYKNKLGIFF